MTHATDAGFLGAFGLTDLDRREIAAAWALIGPEIDGVLSRFYQFAMARDDMRAFFKTEDSRRHAESMQKRHWERLFSGRFDADYFASAEKIGKVHFAIDLPFLMYVSSYSRAARDLQEIALKKTITRFGGHEPAAKAVKAISTALFIDMQAVIDAYFRAQGADRDRAISMLTEGTQRLASGDAQYRIPDDPANPFPKRFANLRLDFNHLAGVLGKVFDSVAEGASEVQRTALRLTGSADDVSHRSQSQAAALEESAAAVTELVQSVGSSKTLFETVSKSTEANQQAAKEGFEIISRASGAMENIQASAAEIAKITDLIDSISLQTNLLALNASVEAARAGESGRGFAVVATEVRNLAQRSAQAAGEINELIRRSLDHVREGGELVKSSGRSLESMLASAEGVSKGVVEVTRVNNEQAMALNEIGATIQDLDRTTQQNAHAASEVSDASRALTDQADRLANLLEIFDSAATARARAA